MKSRALSIAFLAAAALSACAHRGAPFETRQASTADERVVGLREWSGAVTSFAKIGIRDGDRRRNISARLSADGRRFRVELLSPLGTSIATIDVANDGVMYVDAINRTYWQGSLPQLEAAMGSAGAAVRQAAALRDAAPLLFGLLPQRPVRDCAAPEAEVRCVDYGAFQATVSRDGIVSAHASEWSLSFDPPSFPAQRVDVSGATTLDIEHIEIRHAPELRPLTPPADYRCCTLPAAP